MINRLVGFRSRKRMDVQDRSLTRTSFPVIGHLLEDASSNKSLRPAPNLIYRYQSTTSTLQCQSTGSGFPFSFRWADGHGGGRPAREHPRQGTAKWQISELFYCSISFSSAMSCMNGWVLESEILQLQSHENSVSIALPNLDDQWCKGKASASWAYPLPSLSTCFFLPIYLTSLYRGKITWCTSTS
jgi:hypothetical protein